MTLKQFTDKLEYLLGQKVTITSINIHPGFYKIYGITQSKDTFYIVGNKNKTRFEYYEMNLEIEQPLEGFDLGTSLSFDEVIALARELLENR